MLQILTVAIVCFIAGKLGTYLAIPVGNSSAMLFTAGVALAVVLRFGYHIWPGILLGAVLTNLATSLAGYTSSETVTSSIIAFALGVGVTLQALAGAYLLRRFAKFPNPLASEKEVLTFLFFGGILSTLIHSSIAATTLTIAGRIPISDTFSNWGIWWAGDAMSIFIFTPLILVWTLRPAEQWRTRRLAVSLTALVTFAFITLLANYANHKENEHLEIEFEKNAARLTSMLEKNLSLNSNALRAIERLYTASDTVSRAEFNAFTKDALHYSNGIQALSWNPHVLSSGRAAFERTMREQLGKDFKISEYGSDKQLISAGDRPEYVPVSFIEPSQGNESALGYDVYSDAVRKEAIIRARDTGEMATTARITLVQERGRQFGVLTFMPIYYNGTAISTVSERRHNIKGYAVAVYRTTDLVTTALHDAFFENLSYRLIDTGAAAGEQLLFSTEHLDSKQNRLTETAQNKKLFRDELNLKSQSIINMGGRKWQFEIMPTQGYLAANSHDATRYIFLLGLLFAGMTGSIVLFATGRSQVLKKLVDERTLALDASYRQLQSLARQVPGVIYQFKLSADGHTSFPYASEGIHDIYEVTPDQIRTDATPVWNILHPDDFEAIATSIQESARSMQPWLLEYRVNLPTQGLQWLQGQAHPERLEDGGTLWHGFITNITRRKQTEFELQTEQHRLNSIIEGTHVGTWEWNIQTGETRFNEQWANFLGYQLSELMPVSIDTWIKYVHPDDAKLSGELLEKHFSGELAYYEFEARMQHRDGHWIWVLDRGKVATWTPDGKPHMMFGTHQEITSRKLTESALRIAAIAFESQEGMIVTDGNTKILRVNTAFTTITGYTPEEAIGRTPRMLSSGRHDNAFYEAMWASINLTGAWAGEIWNRRKNGEVYPEQLTITSVKDAHGTVTNYVATLTDITASKAASEEIRNLAFYDPLTGLPNRRLLIDRLRQAIAGSARSRQRGALLFLDLDHFKILNDTLGHDMGDLLLQQVAKRLSGCVREGDSVARLGGDEFVMLLENLSEQPIQAAAQTEAIAQKILATLNQPYQIGSHELHSTPSIGATLFNDHEAGVETILKQADIAMYASKMEGRNTLRFYDPTMQSAITTRVEMESELRQAITQQQFLLHYQIQVDDTGRPFGAEALIRWNHPERNMISPIQFIPLAEETGLILPIGQWVLDTACAQLKKWQQNAHYRDLILSINVSAKQFHQANFVTQVRDAIQRHGIDPTKLKLELTESMLIKNIDDIINKMTTLNLLGVNFSLDDFGTGYSSLQYLKKLPLFQLKIDRSFVRDIVTDESDLAIVRTIIAMAHSLDLDVIAEGVETEEQRQLLLSINCSHLQGYLLGKPVPIDEFEAILKSGFL